MRGPTHLAAGVVVGTALCCCHPGTPFHAVVTIACASLGSLLPDIDTCTSKLGKFFPPLSFTVQLLFGHRTLFHSLIPYVICFVLGIKYLPTYTPLFTSAGFGILSHLFLDLLNPAGVPLLWPLQIRFKIARFQSGGLFDCILCVALILIAGISLYHLTPLLFPHS